MVARTLAASVVVTLSLAELGCTSSSGVDTRNPPREVDADQPEEALIGRNPPDPGLASAGQQEANGDGGSGGGSDGGGEPPDAVQARVTITQQPDGTCLASEDVECPAGKTCDAVSKQVECPPERQLPTAKNPDDVRKRDNGQCWEHRKIRCPEGARCNPPPPRRVMCPSDEQP